MVYMKFLNYSFENYTFTHTIITMFARKAALSGLLLGVMLFALYERYVVWFMEKSEYLSPSHVSII